MPQGKDPLSDPARIAHLAEMNDIQKQIDSCQANGYYTQARPLRKRLALLRRQLKVYDRLEGYK